MFPENVSKNFDRVKEIAFSELPIEEKIRLFEEFDDIMCFYKDNVTFVKNCFLPIDGFEDYVVNPFGDVISSKGDFIRLLSRHYNSCGYYQVNLYVNRKMIHGMIHKLVANTFLPNTENKPQVNHIDGSKENNRLDNLEYCTAKENTQHAYRTGLHSKRGRLTEDELSQIVEMLNSGETYKEIADKFNLSANYIHDIGTGRYHKEIYSNINIPKKVNSPQTIRCVETGKVYNSYSEAARELNIDCGSITRYFQGNYSHVKGFHFEKV